MHRPGKWWWGVLPLAGLWAYTATTHSASVEQDLTARAGAALGQVSLDKPSLNVNGRDANLSANAFSPDDVNDATTSIAKIAGVRLVNNHAKLVALAQPYNFTIEKTGDTVTLSGSVPRPEVRQSILDAVRAEYPSAKVVDRLTYARGAPGGFQAGAKFGLQQLPSLASGTLAFNDGTLSVNGVASDRERAAALAENLKSLPNGLTLGPVNVEVKSPAGASAASAEDTQASAEDAEDTQSVAAIPTAPPAESVATEPLDTANCQSLFNDITQNDIIEFETGSARIGGASAGLLGSVVTAAQRCPTGKIEIHGYTDSEGSAEANRALAQRRADAVRQHLANAGVDDSRLSAVGHGQANPVASNDTQDGRAKNRRIEFRVK